MNARAKTSSLHPTIMALRAESKKLFEEGKSYEEIVAVLRALNQTFDEPASDPEVVKAAEFALWIPVRPGQVSNIVTLAESFLLRKRCGIYQRGGKLVRVIKVDTAAGPASDVRRPAGATIITSVREAWLVEAMNKSAKWVKLSNKKKDGEEYKVLRDIDPPTIYAKTLMERGEWRFPVLRGVLSAPTLDRDGRIIETPGYDAQSGLLLDFADGTFPPVPEQPTQEDAREALARLARPFRAFPFVDDASRSVALSAMMSVLIRPNQTAPLHAFDAPTAGTGKSVLAEAVGLLATGVTPPAMSIGHKEEEFEKRLAAMLMAGDPVILLDNIERPLGDALLCSTLTQASVKCRVLGLSEIVTLPSTAFILVTGNNVVLAGDVTRRSVSCRLDAQMERPDSREFDFSVHDEVMRQRPELVVDALTVLRAYHVAGRPVKLRKPMGSFEDWSWVRGALVWLGCADPELTREPIIEGDPKKQDLADVMDLWWKTLGDQGVTTAELDKGLLDDIDPMDIEGLKARLVEAAECRVWSSKSVGWWLTNHKNRVVDGRYFHKRPGKQSVWSLRVADGAGEDVPF